MDELEQLIERKKELESKVIAISTTMQGDGWRLMRDALQEQLRAHRNMDYSTGIKSLDGAFVSANLRGVVEGLQIAANQPQIMLAELQTDIQTLSEQIADLADATEENNDAAD